MKKRYWLLGGLVAYGVVMMTFDTTPVPTTAAPSRPVPRVGSTVQTRPGSWRCTSGDEHRQLMGVLARRDREALARFVRERQSCVVLLDATTFQVTGAEGLDYLKVAVPGEYQTWVVQRELVDVVAAPTPSPAP